MWRFKFQSEISRFQHSENLVSSWLLYYININPRERKFITKSHNNADFTRLIFPKNTAHIFLLKIRNIQIRHKSIFLPLRCGNSFRLL